MFPSTIFTLYLLEARIPCATLTLPEQPEQPERTVHIILPLYNALAYPKAYYAPGSTLTPIPDLRPLITAKDELRSTNYESSKAEPPRHS